ncbi:MAG: protein BatD [Epsilonproteobacteria bacterium]|nr:protein BatD [Campylobacterota bacterium]
MKNLSLGRIAFLILLPILLLANVSVRVDKKEVYPNEKITLEIEAIGDRVRFPVIDDIEGYPIESRSSSTRMVINGMGGASKKITRKYSFRVDKNITIPSFKIVVDNKEYQSAPIDIKVVKSKPKSLPSKDAEVILKAAKKDIYLGEGVEVDLILKFKRNSNIRDLRVDDFKATNFWYEQIGNPIKRVENGYITQHYKFVFFPQKSGKLKLGPVVVSVAKAVKTQDPFMNDFLDILFENYVWEKIYSNVIEFNVKPLPENLEVYGDFEISGEVDKKRVQANKPVNFILKIKGVGNIDDIKKFDLEIPNAVVYSDEPQIKKRFVSGEIEGEFIQKFAIIADRNYTIPPIEFKYFSKSLKKVVTKKTKPIDIEVVGGSNLQTTPLVVKSTAPVEEKSKEVKVIYKEEKSYLKYLFLIVGFGLGVGAVLFYQRVEEPKKETPIIKKIKRAKSDKELLDILLPYSNLEELKEILEKLEENVYKSKSHNIDRGEIVEIMEELEE